MVTRVKATKNWGMSMPGAPVTMSDRGTMSTHPAAAMTSEPKSIAFCGATARRQPGFASRGCARSESAAWSETRWRMVPSGCSRGVDSAVMTAAQRRFATPDAMNSSFAAVCGDARRVVDVSYAIASG